MKGNWFDVKNFCKLFIFSEDDFDEINVKMKREKYFARSFIYLSWKDFNDEHFKDSEGIIEIEFDVEFAWSVWSCIFNGYPDEKKCVTLEWAIEKYNVEVEIEGEEGSMCFEETIKTLDGKPIYESQEMPTYICENCNDKRIIGKYCCLNDEECSECSHVGEWRLVNG